MAKVLLVDDEPDIELLVKQKFRKQIADGTFELLFALNGQEALDIVKKHPNIVVVVSDVNMPEMDGLTLLDKLKDVSPATKTIVISAYGDTKTWRAAMNKGAYDFVTKPINFNELGELIERSVNLYKAPESPLYIYQLCLASAFPPRVDLSYPHIENIVLWDAFHQNDKELTFLGVTCLPSPIPMDIAVGVAHALFKSGNEELPFINKNISAHFIIGKYHLETNVFSFKTNGAFKLTHLRGQEHTPIKPTETALLEPGDTLIFTFDESNSSLSFTRINNS